jgi:hypothetical protein
MDSLSRLDRPIVGARLHRGSSIVERAASRAAVRPPTVEIPDHTRDTEVRIRANRRRADPHPNAPQLIRLNRNPFVLHKGFFERHKLTKLSLVRPERRSVSEMVSEARGAYIKVALIRPVELHIRPAPRPRLSASAWLSGQEQGVGIE